MPEIQNAEPLIDYPPQVLFRAMLREHLMSFTQYSFEVIRPDIPFRPNWHLEAMTHKPGGKTVSVITSDHETYFIEYVTRGINTAPEAHGHWYDYIQVLDGEGSITYGGTQEGAHDVGDQELRGGALTGGKTITLHPGDRLVVPPGLVHLFTATPGNTFTYLIFKQRV